MYTLPPKIPLDGLFTRHLCLSYGAENTSISGKATLKVSGYYYVYWFCSNGRERG